MAGRGGEGRRVDVQRAGADVTVDNACRLICEPGQRPAGKDLSIRRLDNENTPCTHFHEDKTSLFVLDVALVSALLDADVNVDGCALVVALSPGLLLIVRRRHDRCRPD